MDDLTLQIYIELFEILIFGGGTLYVLYKYRKEFCTTVESQRCFSIILFVVLSIVLYHFPPELIPSPEFADLHSVEGVLRYNVHRSRKGSTSYTFTLEGDRRHFTVRLCDDPEVFGEKLSDKRVRLWVLYGYVYQAEVGQEVVYSFANAQKRLHDANVLNVLSHLESIMRLLAVISVGVYSLTEFLKKKRKEGTTYADDFMLAEKEEEKRLSAAQFLVALLMTIFSAVTVKYCFLSDTVASNLRLARLASYEYVLYPPLWIGSYDDMVGYYRRAMQLAKTEEDKQLVVRARYVYFHNIYLRFHNNEWRQLDSPAGYELGAESAAKMARYVAANKEIYDAVGRDDKFKQDYGLSFMWQAEYKRALGDYQAAENLIDKSLTIKDDWAESYYLKALIHIKKEEWERGLTVINRAIDLAGGQNCNDVDFRYTRYYILKAMGNDKEAEKDEVYAEKYKSRL